MIGTMISSAKEGIDAYPPNVCKICPYRSGETANRLSRFSGRLKDHRSASAHRMWIDPALR
jgi:hypothetical protein